MPDILLPIIPGTLPQDCYPASADAFQKLLLGLARAKLTANFNGVVYGENAPAASDWDKLWVRQDSGGNLMRIYTHGSYGVWVSPHPIPASSKIRQLWVGSEDELKSFDEGVDEAPGPVTGPFWEVDHNFDFKFLLGPGTGTVFDEVPARIVAVGDTGGEEKHKLTEDELAAHNHQLLRPTREDTGDPCWESGNGTAPTDIFTEDAGGDKYHENMPPYRGIYVIKRTARTFYRV